MELANADNHWVTTLSQTPPELLHQAHRILSSSLYSSLSTCSSDGIPWNSPLFFAFDAQFNIYWSSAITSRHSQNLDRNAGRAAISIYATTNSQGAVEGFYGSGVAAEVDRTCAEVALPYLQARAKNLMQRTVDDYWGDSPRRIYRLELEEAWLTGERVESANQLVDTKVSLDLSALRACDRSEF